MEILPGTLLTQDTVNATDFPLQNCPVRTKQLRTKFNQELLNTYACFYAAPIAAALDVFDLPDHFDAMTPIRKGWDELIKEGKFTPGFGGRMADGVDKARHIVNELFPNTPVASYRVDIDSIEFWRAIAKGWAPCIGRYASKSDVADISKDGVLDANVAGANKFGHFFRCEAGINGIDNYYGRVGFPNTFKMPDFQEKIESGYLFKSAYIFLPK